MNEAGPSSRPAAPSSFRDFADSLKDARDLTLADRLSSGIHSSQPGTAVRFAQVCLQRAAAAEGAELDQGKAPLASRNIFDDDQGEEDRMHWILEARTWELLHLLCADRYLPRAGVGADGEVGFEEEGFASQLHYYQTPQSVISDLLEKNRDLRELKIVREWLSSQLPPIHIAEVRKGYAPFSKSRLKAERRTQVGGIRTSTNKAIRSLDPDAESRGQGKWDSEDSSYAKALHRTLFEYARAGELDAAFDLARQADQPWKAASLRGAILYHQALHSPDDVMDGDDFDDNVGGNRNRLLWKAVCSKLAASPTLDVYEKALYGSLAGQLQGPIAVSDTWEEHLWAHVNAAFEARVDDAFESEDAKNWWGQEGGGSIKVLELKTSSADPHAKESVRDELKSIFERVKGTEKGSVNLQANNLYHVVQEAVILDGVDELLIHVESRLLEMRATLEPKRYVHVARFFSHLIIYFRLLHRPLPASTCNSILRHYVEALEHAGEDELVAMYASSLERESAEETYARFLASLNIDMPLAERKAALLRANEHSLDTASVARLVVQIIFGEAYPSIARQTLIAAHGLDPLAALNTELTEVEARLISAIDWLTFDESTRADAVFQSNALMRLFLSSGKLHAARTTLFSLPESVVADLDDMVDLTFGDKTEHLHYRQFFSALSASLSFREVLSKQPSRASKLEAHTWREALSNVLVTAKDASLEVLTGDWLKLSQADEEDQDGTANREEAERRLVELARIRQIYIPEVILRLHFMFFDTRQVLGADSLRYIIVDLPILVADERYRLYLEFVTREGGNRLKEYLEHVRRANIESL